MGELGRIDDELFALDYRAELPIRADVTPGQPTLRLAQGVPREHRMPSEHGMPWEPGVPSEHGMWVERRTGIEPAVPYFGRGGDETDGDVAIVAGFAILLVVVLAAAGLVLWWWA
jgi:hypothetical protein